MVSPSFLSFFFKSSLSLILLWFSSVSVPSCASGFFEVSRDDNRIVVTQSGRVVLKYRFGSVPHKPFVEELVSPSGKNVLRDSPEDHKHHHGLMFAIAVDGVNFWEEQTAPGDQRHIDFSTVGTNDAGETEKAFWIESLGWVNPANGVRLLLEERTLETIQYPENESTLMTWQSRFSLPPETESAKFEGSKYFGLGIRFPVSMDKGNDFLNADGGTGVDGTNDQRSKWCAYSAEVDGTSVTVAVFDHPRSLRFPAVWYTMNNPFSYISATLNLEKEPYEMKEGQEVVLRYGLAVWDGKKDRQDIEEVYGKWCEFGH